jgi:hypothetical protein
MVESGFKPRKPDSKAHNPFLYFSQGFSQHLTCLRKSTRIHSRQVGKSQEKEDRARTLFCGVYMLIVEIYHKQINKWKYSMLDSD